MVINFLFGDNKNKLDIKQAQTGLCDNCKKEISSARHGYDVLHKETRKEEKFCYFCMPKDYWYL